MTEAEWLAGTDLLAMADYLDANHAGPAHSRKAKLLLCAFLRLCWPLLTDRRSRRAIEMGEDFVDGLADLTTFRAAVTGAKAVAKRMWSRRHRRAAWSVEKVEFLELVWSLGGARTAFAGSMFVPSPSPTRSGTGQVLVDAKRLHFNDIFGNPFRPARIDPRWLTPNVTDLARTAYSERTFDGLPVLADALEDAGCDDADVLSHCRSGGPHVRGCWVLDLLLGKG